MNKILHIHAEHIESLDDIYRQVREYITDTTPLVWDNLDALSDVLSELELEKIVIHGNQHLKQVLERDHDDREGEMSLYYRLLDVLIDLEDVEIELDD